MTSRQKQRQRIEHNPSSVRFRQLDNLLRSASFVGEQEGTSHVVYRHASGRRVVVARPHGTGFVKPVYVRAALAAIRDVEVN